MDKNLEIPKLIEKEFYVLTVDKLSKKSRIHTRESVQQWIDNLKNQKVKNYKIEYALEDVREEDIKNNFINESLYCGIITSLELRGDDLYAKTKFKTKIVINKNMIEDPNFFDNLTLTPKGKGNVRNNIIYNFELICFNLVENYKSVYNFDIDKSLDEEKAD